MTKLNHEECRILNPSREEEELYTDHSNDLVTIFFFLLRNCLYTWRGEGQEVPRGATIIGVARLYCPYTGLKREVKGILFDPIRPGNEDYAHITMNWENQNLFVEHSLEFSESPLRAHFVAPVRMAREHALD